MRRNGSLVPAAVALALMLLGGARTADADIWSAAAHFRYVIENVSVADLGAGSWSVRVVFSVADPTNASTWDIKAAAPFQTSDPSAAPPVSATLVLDIAWDAAEFANTGNEYPAVSTISTTVLGKAVALAVQVRDLHKTASQPCTGPGDCPGVATDAGRYWVERTVTPLTFTWPVTVGRVAIEGHPVCAGLPECVSTPNANVPVAAATADFAFTPADPSRAIVPDARRSIVSLAKCQTCHDGTRHGLAVVPRLSLHGANRTENLKLCVMCHNPNQTDLVYRYRGGDPAVGKAEVPVDMKVMVHAIHAGGFRRTPYVVIGRNSSINDFSRVRFPGSLRDCASCHVETNGRGTYELPLAAGLLGTTISTRSRYLVPLGSTRVIDLDPVNNLRITPTAAACSACHDDREARLHMVFTGRASFATTQRAIGTTVNERCATCHGPGRTKDVRRVHEIGD